MYDIHTVYNNVEAATKLVEHLNNTDEDGWNYLLTLTTNKQAAVIEIYDETGYFLGLL
jgi:hypothetical protein